MPLLNDAEALYVGDVAAEAMYLGHIPLWPPISDPYEDVVAASTPYHWWKLNETVAPIADSGSSPIGTIVEDTPLLGQPPLVTQAGTTSFSATVAQSGRFRTNAEDWDVLQRGCTFECWFSTTTTEQEQDIIRIFGNYSSSGEGVAQFDINGNNLRFYAAHGTGGSFASYSPPGGGRDGTVFHMVGIRRQTPQDTDMELELWVNGVLRAERRRAGSITNGTAGIVTRIGGYGASGALSLAGNLDQCAIYDRVLTPQEIITHYQAGVQ